jgi:hypothetical protein
MSDQINILLTIVDRQNNSNVTKEVKLYGQEHGKEYWQDSASFSSSFFFFATLFLLLRYLLLVQGHWASEFLLLT